jgi:hypothetical protein
VSCVEIISSNTGQSILIDEDSYWAVCGFVWGIGKQGYCTTSPYRDKKQRQIKLHRMIMNVTDPKIYVDHINGNKLDNRKANLRLCGATGSSRNRGKPKKQTASQYKGLYYNKKIKKWCARVCVDKKKVNLGYFETELEAALAYNEGVGRYHGEFARPNVIKGHL